jgi:hypothetical protein
VQQKNGRRILGASFAVKDVDIADHHATKGNRHRVLLLYSCGYVVAAQPEMEIGRGDGFDK